MTEYEIADLTASVMSNYLTSVSNFFALLTAYLVAAFFVGTRLSRGQVAFVNMCFVVFSGSSAFMSASIISRALELNSQSVMEQIGPARSLSGVAGFTSTLGVSIVLIIGCLWFMRNVRKADSEIRP